VCGLFGGTGPGIDRIDEPRLRAALGWLRHRGPDAENLWRAPGVVLGHRRLSIIDLAVRADQPMQRGPLTIVYNGEIYNYRSLRRQLEARGRTFSTSSDTEVLLEGILADGISFLSQIEGMFAFGLWDERDGSLTLARDRFGEKPLFLLTERDRTLFASELAALEALVPTPLREDDTAIGLYFRFSYVPAPYAPLENTRQIEPGTWMRIGRDRSVAVERYYQLRAEQGAPIQYQDAVVELRNRLTAAISDRLTAADVPVATLLSGGLDSSIVTTLASRIYGRRIRAYSLSFPDDPECDEAPYARAVAERNDLIEHRIVPARVDDLLNFTEQVFERLSEPFADASLIPTAFLLSKVEEKVVLGGDGADEIFAGYGVYPAMTLSAKMPGFAKRLLQAIPHHKNPTRIKNPLLRAAALFHANIDSDPLAEYLRWRTYATAETLAPLGIDSTNDPGILSQLAATTAGGLRDIQLVDITFNLPNDMLRKLDIASMMFGIEARLPYLDSALVEFALGLPDKFRMNSAARKRILRSAFAADLPPEILTRRKMGFLMPIRSWFSAGPLRSFLEQLVADQTRFDPKPIKRAMAAHASGAIDHSVLLWSLLVYLRWRDRRMVRLKHAAWSGADR
jgi:asparagine synthase (glutamine-hydrolysing)